LTDKYAQFTEVEPLVLFLRPAYQLAIL